MFKDEFGLPVALDGDGGDTLQRSGAWASGRLSRGDLSAYWFARFVIGQLYLGRGNWRRHPGRQIDHDQDPALDPKPHASFWTDPKMISRDQLINGFVLCRIGRSWRTLAETTIGVILRLGFAPNWRDHLIGQVSLIIRCWHPFSLLLWPVLFVTDLLLVFGALVEAIPWRWKHETMRFVRRSTDDADVDNAVLQYWIAWALMPTPVAWVARNLHAWAMPKTDGTIKLGIKNKLAGAMYWKHRPEAHGDQDLAKLWHPWLEEFTWTKEPRDLR